MTVDIEVPDLVAFAGDVSSGDEQAAGQLDRATITDIYLEEGDVIEEGELFAVIENSYGSCRILAPATGLVHLAISFDTANHCSVPMRSVWD